MWNVKEYIALQERIEEKRFNRYIVECKEKVGWKEIGEIYDLIDTLWNVKKLAAKYIRAAALDLIDTLWNVKEYRITEEKND